MNIFKNIQLTLLIITLLIIQLSQIQINAKGYNYEDYCENNVCQSLQLTANDTLRQKNRQEKILTDTIGFKRSEIPIIHAKLFRNFANLRELDLRDSKVEKYTSESFRHLTNLQILLLSRNYLTVLPENGFSKNHNLQFLWLDSNNIDELEPGSFRNLTRLQYLSLDSNRITELPAGIFDDLTSLYGLYLQYNKIETINDDLFINCKYLNSLHIHENNLKKISNTLFEEKRLEYLDISYNLLEDVSLTFDKIRTLKVESAFRFGQFDLNGAVENLELIGNNLDGLTIGNITLIEKFIWSDENEIDLNFLREAGNLKELSLNSPKITNIQTQFFSTMTELVYLNLSNCHILFLHPNTFNYQDNLEVLDLSNNDLFELDLQLFLPLTKLKHLIIKQNKFVCSKISPNIRDYFQQNSILVESDTWPHTPNENKIQTVGGIICQINYDVDNEDDDPIQNDPKLYDDEEDLTEEDKTMKMKSDVNELRTHLKIIVQNFEEKFKLLRQEIEEIKRRDNIINNVNETFWNQISIAT